jgi:hypothetical protein
MSTDTLRRALAFKNLSLRRKTRRREGAPVRRPKLVSFDSEQHVKGYRLRRKRRPEAHTATKVHYRPARNFAATDFQTCFLRAVAAIPAPRIVAAKAGVLFPVAARHIAADTMAAKTLLFQLGVRARGRRAMDFDDYDVLQLDVAVSELWLWRKSRTTRRWCTSCGASRSDRNRDSASPTRRPSSRAMSRGCRRA